MGQFKPMVKMETTEPSVELKLAKGGAVKMKKGGSTTKAKKMADGGGAMGMMAGTPALVGRPAVNAPVRAPMKPSMASRRKAMMAKPAAPMPTMKKGGKAEGGESKKTHMAEMSKMKGLEKELKSHESKPASKGHKGLKTGGVIDGQGGYKTGGVAMGNGGGYKIGGKTSKKAYATGGTVDTGKPVAMPQGRKPASAPVAISRLAGTYKSGGRATPAESVLLKNNKAENSTAMREAKTDSNLKYGSPKRMNGGGTTSGQGSVTDRERKTMQDLSKGAYDKTGKYNRELEDAMNPLSMMKELAGKAKDYFMPKGSESVTKTKESVTVSPATKKRGGMVC